MVRAIHIDANTRTVQDVQLSKENWFAEIRDLLKCTMLERAARFVEGSLWVDETGIRQGELQAVFGLMGETYFEGGVLTTHCDTGELEVDFPPVNIEPVWAYRKVTGWAMKHGMHHGIPTLSMQTEHEDYDREKRRIHLAKKAMFTEMSPGVMMVTNESGVSRRVHSIDMQITVEQIDAWRKGDPVQHAFPHLSAEEREFITSGITADEWKKVFG